MVNRPKGGVFYYVPEEQFKAFAQLSLLQRLLWLEEARGFTLLAETPKTAHRRERLRRGELFGTSEQGQNTVPDSERNAGLGSFD